MSYGQIQGLDGLQRLNDNFDVVESAELIELASSAETITGTDATKGVTPAGMIAALAALDFPVAFTITGATKVIDFAGVTPGFADADDAFIAIGTWNDGLDIADQTEHFVPIQVHLDSNTSIAKDLAAARLRVDTDVASTLTAIGCLQLRQNISHNVASSAILNASVTVGGAVAVQTGSLLGGYFSIEGTGALTKAGDNDCSALVAVVNHTGGGVDNAFVAMMNGTGQTVSEIINAVCEHGTATVGIAIEKTSNGTAIGTGLKITNATVGLETSLAAIGATGRIAKLFGTAAAANLGDGYGAVEIDLTLSGTVAGYTAAMSSWVNMAADSSGGSQLITPMNVGIYVPSAGTPMASATAIMGMRMQYVTEGGENPGSLYLFSTNIYDNALTALFHVNAKADLTWANGAKSTNAASIPLFHDVTANKTWYVNVYDG